MPATSSLSWYRLQVRARRMFNRIPLKENQKIYVLTFLIGASCGLAAVSFHQLIDFFSDHIILRIAEIPSRWKFGLLFLVPAIGGLIAGVGLHFYCPEARGSGIPQVKKSLHLDGGRIRAKVIWSKMLLSSFNIGTGASLGREGPTVQICAALASLWGRVFVISRRNRQNLIPVGAAAGLAAAFNTPIASLTFVLEEILPDSGARPLGSIVIAAVIAAVIEHAILGERPVFSVPHYELHSWTELVFYALLGLVGGVAGVAFNRGLLRLRKYFREQKSIPIWATPAAGGLILGVLGSVVLMLTGSASIFGVGYGLLNDELQNSLPLAMLLVLGIAKLGGTIISYGSGSSGGIFGPALYIGGMLGGAMGLVTQYSLGDSTMQPEAFALVGMGAVFASIVRAPVTSIIMIFEMTDNYSLILPLMVANIISYALASRWDPIPIYDALLMQDGVHLPHRNRQMLRSLRVRSAMTRTVVSIDANLTVEEAVKHVQGLPKHYHAYPVVDTGKKLVGICTFNDLKRAIASGKGTRALREIAGKQIQSVRPDDVLDAVILKLGKTGVSQLPVVSRLNPERLVGIITMHDVARALSRGSFQEPVIRG